MIHIECMCTCINGNPTCSFPLRCLSENSTCSQQAASHFPTAPPPDPGKGCVGGHFSHFERHFPGRLGLRGQRPISHILTWLCCQLPQQRPDGPLWGLLRRLTRQPRQQLLFDQLFSLQTSLSFNSYFSEGGHMLLSKKKESDFMLWRWMCFFLTYF